MQRAANAANKGTNINAAVYDYIVLFYLNKTKNCTQNGPNAQKNCVWTKPSQLILRFQESK